MESMTGFAQIFWVLLSIVVIDVLRRAYAYYKTYGLYFFNYRRLTDKTTNQTFKIRNFPTGITPSLADIKETYLFKDLDQIPKDRLSGKVFVSGDLTFNIDNTKEFLMLFKYPIKLEFTYNLDDVSAELRAREPVLILKNKSNVVQYIPIVIPVFESSMNINGNDIKIWKPFQNYQIDKKTKTVSIEFQEWGDMKVGVSIIDAPKPDQFPIGPRV